MTQSGTSCPAETATTDLADVAVDEPAERRGRVGVGRADTRVDGAGRNLVVEGRVAGAAQKHGRLGQERRLRGHLRIEACGSRRRSRAPAPTRHRVPSRSCAAGRPPSGRRSAASSGSRRARRASARPLPGRPSARSGRSSPPPAAARERRARSRSRPARPPARGSAARSRRGAPRAPGGAGRPRGGAARTPRPCRRRASAGRPRSSSFSRLRTSARRTSTSIPSPVSSTSIVQSDGRPGLVGQEAAGAFGELRRIEAGVPVRRVERLAALVCLDVHRPARGDEGGDVGDRVADAVALPTALEVERLVEVHRLRRVDRDERDRRLVVSGRRGERTDASASARTSAGNSSETSRLSRSSANAAAISAASGADRRT